MGMTKHVIFDTREPWLGLEAGFVQP